MSRTSKSHEDQDFNIVVIVGEVTTAPVSRELPDGSIVSTFDVVTRTDHGRSSVPVSVDGDAVGIEPDARVFVTGHVRRRFFRTGATVASRTEVVGATVTPLRRRAGVRRAVLSVTEELSAFLGG